MEDMLQKFEFENNAIRMIVSNGEPWLVLKDVCAALGMDTTNIKKISDRLEDDEKGRYSIPTLGGVQETWIINESGLYNIILRSDKPKAKPFRKWVTSEVLPTIRKTGGYVNDDDQFIMTYLPYADENTKQLFKLQLSTIRQQNKKLKEQKPLVEFAETVGSTKDLIDMATMAKLVNEEHIPIGRNRLFEWLRKNKYLRHNNEPYQQYVDKGYFKVKEGIMETAYGPKPYTKTYVTGKGQIYIVEKLRQEFCSDKESA